jgi:DNA invertase Pin-like site-specific DNA recombinase
MNIARIYLRVSTEEQDLTRQAEIELSTRAAGYYIAGVTVRRRRVPAPTGPNCCG